MKSVKIPASEYLCTVNPNTTNLDAEKVDVFYNTISKELFLCKRVIINVQPTVKLLCTRVKGPDEDN